MINNPQDEIIELIIVDENETNTYVPIEDNKKLININSNNKDDKNDDIQNKEMSEDEKQKIELSNNVSNKEALKDKIHEIHNYLRNNGAGYGMNALKVFNLLYGLKKIEEKKLFIFNYKYLTINIIIMIRSNLNQFFT